MYIHITIIPYVWMLKKILLSFKVWQYWHDSQCWLKAMIMIERGRWGEWCCVLIGQVLFLDQEPLGHIIESWLRMWNSETFSLIGFIKVIIWYHYSSPVCPASPQPQPTNHLIKNCSQFHTNRIHRYTRSVFLLILNFDRKTLLRNKRDWNPEFED